MLRIHAKRWRSWGRSSGKSSPTPDTCDRVTIAGTDLTVATGSICRSAAGAGRPTLVYHYVLMGCTGMYFETATCRIDMETQGDLPWEIKEDQQSACTGVFAGVASPGQTSPLRGFNVTNDLKAWNCQPAPPILSGTGSAACYVRKRAFQKND